MRSSELLRLINNLIRIGTVTEVEGKRASVATGDNTIPLRPWLTAHAGKDATWWAPSVGEQVLLLSPTGDLNQAIILPALYQEAFEAPEPNPDVRRTNYRDGTYVEHNLKEKTLTVAPAGDLSILVNGSCVLNTTGDVDVLAEGNALVAADGNAELIAGGNGTIAAAGNLEVEADGILNLAGLRINLN